MNDELFELLSHPGLPLLMKEMEAVLQSIQKQLISCSDDDVDKVLRLKSRALGADDMFRGVVKRLESLKAKHDA